MDSYQLRYALITSLPIFTAVCAEDQLKSIKAGKSFAVIVNNQPSTKEGMHWICFYKSKDSRAVEFFDSYGLGIDFYPKSLQQFCKKHGSFITQSKSQYQSNMSDVCGDYCLWFLLSRFKRKSFASTLSSLSRSDQERNDHLVDSFVKRKFKFPNFVDCKEQCKKLCKMKNVPFSEVCYQKGKRCFRIGGNLFEK